MSLVRKVTGSSSYAGRKRARSSSGTIVRSARRGSMRVPRALSLRGTPKGYYEIPVRIYRKFYYNGSTGFWNTDQDTGSYTGATGYRGMSVYCTPGASYTSLGEGSASATISGNTPGVSELASVFQEFKLVKSRFEISFTSNTPDSNAAATDIPHVFVYQNKLDSVPPSALVGSGQQLTNAKHIMASSQSKPLKIDVIPTVELAVSNGRDDLDTSPVSGLVLTPGYISLNSDIHFRQLKIWIATSSGATNNCYGYIHIVETQIRRYKLIQ